MRRRKRASGVVHALVLTVAAGLMLFAGWGFAQGGRAVKAYTPTNLVRSSPEVIPTNTVRLHVPANSDDPLDQAVKEQVKDALMERFGEELSEMEDADGAEQFLSQSLPEIRSVAEGCLRKKGLAYGAVAVLKMVHFPERTYSQRNGEVVYLPEGDYRTLQVTLGRGTGANWWCVMYPPLCYYDLVEAELPGALSDIGGVLLVDETATQEVKTQFRSLIYDSLCRFVRGARVAVDHFVRALLAALGKDPTSMGSAPTPDI